MSREGLLRPALAGTGAACACAAVWYACRAWTGEALDLLVFPAAIVIALVLRTMTPRTDTRARLLAAALTYLASALAFVPLIATSLENDVARAAGREAGTSGPTAIAYGVALPLSCVTPVLFAAETPEEHGPALAATLLACLSSGLFVSRPRRR